MLSAADWLATHHWPPADAVAGVVGVVGVVVVIGLGGTIVGFVGLVFGVVGFAYGFMGVMYGVVGVNGVCPIVPGAWGVVGFSVGYGFAVPGVVGLTTGTASNLVPNSYEISWFSSSLNLMALPRPVKETKDLSTFQQHRWKEIAEIELVNLNKVAQSASMIAPNVAEHVLRAE